MLTLFITVSAVLLVINILFSNNKKALDYIGLFSYLVLSCLISYLSSIKEIVPNSDTSRYAEAFYLICSSDFHVNSLGFQYFNKFFCNLSFNYLLFFVPLIAYISYIFHVSRKEWYNIYVYFFLITFNIVFLQYTTSGLRQAISMSFMVIAISFIVDNKKLLSLFAALLSAIFHWASLPFLLVVTSFIYIERYISEKKILLIWCMCCALSIFNVMEGFASLLESFIQISHVSSVYFQSDSSFYETGFRIDFFLYSAIPVILYLIQKKKFSDSVSSFNILFKIYLSLNCIAMLLNFIPFSDRLYGYSWFLIPIIIIKFFHMLLSQGKEKHLFYMMFIFVILGYCFVSYDYNFRFLPLN